MATERTLTDAFAAEMTRRGHTGLVSGDSTRALGADFGGGAQRQRSTVQAARIRTVASRAGRLHALRAAGVRISRFFKASSEQAGLWGADVTGIADGALRRLRVLAGGATTTRVAGRSLELDLALADTPRLDPAYEAHLSSVGRQLFGR